MTTPSPIDWVRMLYTRLAEQRAHARHYDMYYSGEHRLEIIDQDFREVFGVKAGTALTAVLEPARVNLSRVAIEAPAERLIVEGFRVGEDDDQAGADEAKRWWLENDLDEMSGVAHTESGVKGAAFTLVWPDTDNDPVVSIEDYEQVALARMPTPPYDIIAALKVWIDEWTGDEQADLYLPDEVYRFKKARGALGSVASGLILPYTTPYLQQQDWIPDVFDSNAEVLTNPFGVVPITEIANRARLLRAPASSLVDVAPLHDAADKVLGDMIIAASFGAVPVRYATGLKFKTDKDGHPVDAHGNKIEPMSVRGDRMLVSPDANSRFGTLEGATLEGFAKASNEIMARFRTVTRVPYHYIDMGGTSGVAGETLKAFEGPLMRYVSSLELRYGSGWRKTMGHCLYLTEFSGQRVQTVWADTETRSIAQESDAFQKLVASGTPFEIACEKVLGWPRELIARAMKEREKQGLLADQAFAALQHDAAHGPGGTNPALPPGPAPAPPVPTPVG